MKKRLYRSKNDRKITGVCGGIAEYLNIDSSLVRILTVVLVLLGTSGLWIYIACALIIPEEPDNIAQYEDINSSNDYYDGGSR